MHVLKKTIQLKCTEFAHLFFFFVSVAFFGYFPKPPQWVNPPTRLVPTGVGVKQWVSALAACCSHLGSFFNTLGLCFPLHPPGQEWGSGVRAFSSPSRSPYPAARMESVGKVSLLADSFWDDILYHSNEGFSNLNGQTMFWGPCSNADPNSVGLGCERTLSSKGVPGNSCLPGY